MSSLILPCNSFHLLHPPTRHSNHAKTVAATAAALLTTSTLLPSSATCLPTFLHPPPPPPPPPSTSLDSTNSPLPSPNFEFSSFTFQLDQLDQLHHNTHSIHSIDSINSINPTPSPSILSTQFFKRASLQTDPLIASDHLPTPFDTSLGTHFESSTCGPFIQHMASDPDLIACHPFSFLLSTSNAFFHSLRGTPGYPSLPTVLASTCAADLHTCTSLIDEFASRLTASDACASELEKHNALAVEALGGLQNFRLMRSAGCLQVDLQPSSPISSTSPQLLHPSSNPSSNPLDTTSTLSSPHQISDNHETSPPTLNPTPSSNPNIQNSTTTTTNATSSSSAPLPSSTSSRRPSFTYCFEAAANNSRPDDLYYYYLPAGTSLPSGTQPTCDTCTQNLMKLYSIAAANTSLGIHETYPAARTVTNAHCGPEFAPMPADRASLANRSTTLHILTLLSSLLLSAFL